MFITFRDENQVMSAWVMLGACTGLILVIAVVAYAVALTRDNRDQAAQIAAMEVERSAADEFRSRERWFASIVEHAEDLIVLIDADLRVKWTSPWVGRLLGLSSDSLVGRTVLDVVDPRDRSRVSHALRQVEVGQRVRVEYRVNAGTRDEMWMESTATNRLDDPDVAAIISVSRDVTARHRSTQALAHRAAHDDLTGLFNRSEMEVRLAAALDHRAIDGRPLTLAFMDIDHFKEVNDERGHGAGDRVLQAMAETIRAEVRSHDIVSRLGGDEIVVALIDTDVEAATSVVDRIRLRVGQPLDIDGEPLVATVSVGIAAAQDGDDVATLLRRSDLALYEAKRLGRDRYAIYTDDLIDLSDADQSSAELVPE